MAELNSDVVNDFWRKRGERRPGLAFESICNLEEDPERLALKIKAETERIFSLLTLSPDMRLLDLGAGCGQWAVRFAPLLKEVVAVERVPALCEIGAAEAARRGLDNIRFVNRSAEDFRSKETFDLVLISGLFMYLNDQQAEAVAAGVPGHLAAGGRLLLRETTCLLDQRYVIDKYSHNLKDNYAALYRTRDEFVELFQARGLKLEKDGWMFDDGFVLNKFTETRMRYYLFQAGS